MHWRNSNFQYAYFIFGACHTLIEAHRKCVEAIETRELALCEAEENPIKSADARGVQFQANVDQAKAELEFLTDCKLKMESLIGRVPTMDDYQNNQREEWRLELEFRAENFLLTTNSIPTDHFATMRQHPDFPVILAKINELRLLLSQGTVPELLAPSWRTELLDSSPAKTPRLR